MTQVSINPCINKVTRREELDWKETLIKLQVAKNGGMVLTEETVSYLRYEGGIYHGSPTRESEPTVTLEEVLGSSQKFCPCVRMADVNGLYLADWAERSHEIVRQLESLTDNNNRHIYQFAAAYQCAEDFLRLSNTTGEQERVIKEGLAKLGDLKTAIRNRPELLLGLVQNQLVVTPGWVNRKRLEERLDFIETEKRLREEMLTKLEPLSVMIVGEDVSHRAYSDSINKTVREVFQVAPHVYVYPGVMIPFVTNRLFDEDLVITDETITPELVEIFVSLRKQYETSQETFDAALCLVSK